MNKFYAIFASALIVSTSAVAEVRMEEEGASATRTVRVVNSSFLDGFQAATRFAGGGAMHSGDSPMTEERFQKKKAKALGDFGKEKKVEDSDPVFSTAEAKQMHADMVWALGQAEGNLSKLSFVSAEAGVIYSVVTALSQALQGTFEEGAGSLATAGTVAAAMYMAEKATAADIAGGVTLMTRNMVPLESFTNPTLKKTAAKFAVKFGKIVEQKASRAGKLVLSWVVGTSVVDESTAMGRAYIKVRTAAAGMAQAATRTAKGWFRRAAEVTGAGYVAAKRIFGFGKTTAEVTA